MDITSEVSGLYQRLQQSRIQSPLYIVFDSLKFAFCTLEMVSSDKANCCFSIDFVVYISGEDKVYPEIFHTTFQCLLKNFRLENISLSLLQFLEPVR